MYSKNLKNQDHILYVFFGKITPGQILQKEKTYARFPKRIFMDACRAEMNHLSETEISELYAYLGEKMDVSGEENCQNVFRLVKSVSSDLLLIRDSRPVCSYQKLLRWRDLVRIVGEDLPICAFLAERARLSGIEWLDFEWNPVIGNDNMQLNRILQRGISDNHFHLFGSAPAFLLSWMKLMNQPANAQYSRALQDMELSKRIQDGMSETQEDSLAFRYKQAALIRLVLVYYLRQTKLRGRQVGAEIAGRKERIQQLLLTPNILLEKEQELQIQINSFRTVAYAENKKNSIDYALSGCHADSENYDFEGERVLLYQMLRGEVGGRKIPDYLMNWFYTYLVIKSMYYRELVQVNEELGFENFSQYQWRKGVFLFTEEDDERMIRHAVLGSLNSDYFRSLELRVVPKSTAAENKVMIDRYDSCIRRGIIRGKTENWYYVFHFPKVSDSGIETGSSDSRQMQNRIGLTTICRHKAFRSQLWENSYELLKFREGAPKQAARVLGIDACAMEIGCRPEVFAPAFRLLTEHIAAPPNLYHVRQWKITYHVGEDFLDAADGLRAIDEAIRFFDMKPGDRLGHATVLGQDIGSWYEIKKYTVILTQQDYLDNVMWLYHKLTEYDIQDCETLKGYLLQQFDETFSQVYGQFMNEDFIKVISRFTGLDKDPILAEWIGNTFNALDIYTYYAAWKLRGDDPELYLYDKNAIVRRNLRDSESRSAASVLILFLYYHYSGNARKEGRKHKIVTFPDFYVRGVAAVQKKMQQMVAERGICIECNPSSNYLISTIESYEEHPISKFYNIGLTMDPEELRQCPQIHVSVNTDDKGVFHTSLENEYALLACAMEQAVDKNGKLKYPRQMVYDWLDHIRENGNQQRF